MTSHDEKLDQYIDSLNACQQPAIDADDAELLNLYRTVDQLQVLRQPDWPPESFATDMAAQLFTALTFTSNGHVTPAGMAGDADTGRPNPWVRSHNDAPRLEAFPWPPNRFRRSLQIAGALAAFSIFALVLVLIFGGVRGEESRVPGFAPPVDEDVEQIVFSARYEGNNDIYLVNADGTGLTRLTTDPGNDTFPSWSPDGSSIVFISDRTDTHQVFVMDADGSDIRQLTHGGHRFARPAWSPGGSRIAALRIGTDGRDDVMTELVVMNTDGSDLRSLTAGTVPAELFDWSPDGREIAVSMNLSGRGPQIFIYDVADGTLRDLLPSDTFQYEPRWSPDGASIAFTEGEHVQSNGTTSITLVDASGENRRVLHLTRGSAYSHDWSPQGDSIALASSDAAGTSGIFVVPVDEPQSSQFLTDSQPHDFIPRWSPDAEHILAVRNEVSSAGVTVSSLIVVHVDNGGTTTVAEDIDGLSPPAWRPDGSAQPMPADPTPEKPTATLPDDAPEQLAIQIVREFLSDPDAELEARQSDGDLYEVLQAVGDSDDVNIFQVDIAHRHVVLASYAGHSTLHNPANPVDEEVALQIAADHARMWAPRFDDMKLWTTDSGSFGQGKGNGDRLFAASWSVQDDETGAWMPPRVSVTVNMATGLVHGFFQSLEAISYSTVPTISAEQAGNIALEQAYSERETEEQFEIRSVELVAFEESLPFANKLVWEVHIGMGVGVYFVDAHNGEIVLIDVPVGDEPGTSEPPAIRQHEPGGRISKGDVVNILSG